VRPLTRRERFAFGTGCAAPSRQGLVSAGSAAGFVGRCGGIRLRDVLHERMAGVPQRRQSGTRISFVASGLEVAGWGVTTAMNCWA